MNIFRGTTPTLKFQLPFQASELTQVYLTAKQDTQVVFEKDIDDLTLDGSTITCELTQTETLALDVTKDVAMQFRFKFGTKADASKLIYMSVEQILKEGVI